jgi:osmotically inducible protein OsmC
MKRSANATWKGGLKDGAGSVGVHASCFSMALSAQLGERGITPESIETTSTITFENLTLTRSLLKTSVRAPGADKAKVEAAAAAAKAGCPISKVLKLEIALELTVSA